LPGQLEVEIFENQAEVVEFDATAAPGVESFEHALQGFVS